MTTTTTTTTTTTIATTATINPFEARAQAQVASIVPMTKAEACAQALKNAKAKAEADFQAKRQASFAKEKARSLAKAKDLRENREKLEDLGASAENLEEYDVCAPTCGGSRQFDGMMDRLEKAVHKAKAEAKVKEAKAKAEARKTWAETMAKKRGYSTHFWLAQRVQKGWSLEDYEVELKKLASESTAPTEVKVAQAS